MKKDTVRAVVGDVGEDNLSIKKLCYGCAKGRMVEFFDKLWAHTHPGGKWLGR